MLGVVPVGLPFVKCISVNADPREEPVDGNGLKRGRQEERPGAYMCCSRGRSHRRIHLDGQDVRRNGHRHASGFTERFDANGVRSWIQPHGPSVDP